MILEPPANTRNRFHCILCRPPQVLSGVVDPMASMDLVFEAYSCAAMISASVLSLRPAISSHCYVFLVSATSFMCRWYVPCRGLSLHDGLSSSFSSVGFCCLKHSLCRSFFPKDICLIHISKFIKATYVPNSLHANVFINSF